MIRRFTFSMILLMMLAMPAIAQLDTIDANDQFISFSLAGQNTNSTTAVTAATPVNEINGHAAAYVARQTANDEVVSEVINAEIEGQWKFLEGFIVGERDIHRGIHLKLQSGYRLTPGEYKYGLATITGGAGNYTANTTDDTPNAEAEITFGWTSYVQLDIWKTSTTMTIEPKIDFGDYQADIESTLRHALDQNFEVGVTAKGYFASDPVTDERFHSQYLLFATWKP